MLLVKEIGINTRDWVDSVQDRHYWRALVDAALNLRVPYAIKLVVIQLYMKEFSVLSCGDISAFSVYLFVL